MLDTASSSGSIQELPARGRSRVPDAEGGAHSTIAEQTEQVVLRGAQFAQSLHRESRCQYLTLELVLHPSKLLRIRNPNSGSLSLSSLPEGPLALLFLALSSSRESFPIEAEGGVGRAPLIFGIVIPLTLLITNAQSNFPDFRPLA